MTSKPTTGAEAGAEARRPRLNAAIKASLRELSIQLSLLNHLVSAQVDLRQVDLNCLDLIVRQGPLSPSALARRAGLHSATLTGILDRLERGGWVTRDRDPSDRRSVVVSALHKRNAELMRLYAGMNTAMDQICAGCGIHELEIRGDFLGHVADAGRDATRIGAQRSADPRRVQLRSRASDRGR
jgi:DNA-binding MarR family transcriptional regulator